MNIVLFFLMPNSLNYGIDLTSSKCYNLRFPSCLNIEDVQFPSSSNKTPRFFLHCFVGKTTYCRPISIGHPNLYTLLYRQPVSIENVM